MNDLLRDLAPISDAAWEQIEMEAKRTLRATLAARKLVDFIGPLGWEVSADNSGRTRALSDTPVDGLEARLRQVLPLAEFRVPFSLARTELEDIGRGSTDPDLDAVRKAAFRIALAEDRAAFHGYPAAGIRGLCSVAGHAALTLTDDYFSYHNVVAEAVHALATMGIGGPYAVALGPRCYEGLTKTMSDAGFPVLEYVRRLVDGPIVRAMGLDGAAVLSLRGGDFSLTVGQDHSIGYLGHTRTDVELYIQESFTFRVLSPEAAVPLAYEEARRAEAAE